MIEFLIFKNNLVLFIYFVVFFGLNFSFFIIEELVVVKII